MLIYVIKCMKLTEKELRKYQTYKNNNNCFYQIMDINDPVVQKRANVKNCFVVLYNDFC